MPNGRDVKQYLTCLIDDIDAGRTPQRRALPFWVRSIAVPAAVGATMGLAACDDTPEPEVTKDEARQAYEDGTVDDLCAELDAAAGCDLCDLQGWNNDDVCDDFCVPADEDCSTPLYGVESEANCADAVDDDGDGAIDCCDTDCAEAADCAMACPEYGAPPPPESVCGDCLDDDCDGLDDADDPDCATVEYGVPFEADCADGLDDDADSLIDCCDSDCTGDEACSVACPEYGGPFAETICDDCIDNNCDGDVDMDDATCNELYGVPSELDCADGVDDDADGLLDCCDDDCTGDESCSAMCPDYGGPFPEENCGDCVDNDCDGSTDGDDLDCTTVAYGVPMEDNCSDGLDDDADSLIDCCDDDCTGDAACSVACPEYGAPLSETSCDDCIDNDCDGNTDAADDECAATLYAAPM